MITSLNMEYSIRFKNPLCNLLGFLVLALLISTQHSSARTATANRSVPVIIGEAQLIEYMDRVEALGTLRASESINITAKVSDVLKNVYFIDGQEVNMGDLLVELYSDEEIALLDEAEASREEARRQLERILPLVEIGGAPDSLVDERTRQLDTAEARYRIIQSRLQDRIITAPFSGRIGLRLVSPGSLLSPGQAITTLDDLTSMQLDINLPSIFITSIEKSATVQARSRDLPGQLFTGTLQTIDTRIDPVTRSVKVRAILPNEERLLRPGMLMVVDILSNSRKTIFVDESSILSLGQNHYIYVVEVDSNAIPKALLRPVTIGSRKPGYVEITAGLSAGERYVAEGLIRLRDGIAVTVQSR
jgi:membrane fusion protein, multidrug efflux system